MSRRKKQKAGFSAREIRAVLLLLPLLAVLAWIIWAANRPRLGDGATALGDVVAETANEERQAPREREQQRATPAEEEPTPILVPFDPNTAAYEDFRAMGIPKNTAASIVKYRERGKVFQIPEDFATCYGLTDSMYAALKPYIRIGDEYRIKPAPKPEAKPVETAAAPTKKQRSKVDINSADSTTLVSVRGIGPRTAEQLIIYRERLGGFHSIEQICEMPVVNEKNWMLMREEIWADSCEITKIDVNFALPNTITSHPYINNKLGRKILSNRQMRGGWSTIEDMIDDHTLTEEEAEKLSPYLHFQEN